MMARPPSIRRGALEAIPTERIRKLYWDDGLSTAQLAKRFGLTQASMLTLMRTRGIPRRAKAGGRA